MRLWEREGEQSGSRRMLCDRQTEVTGVESEV